MSSAAVANEKDYLVFIIFHRYGYFGMGTNSSCVQCLGHSFSLIPSLHSELGKLTKIFFLF